MKHNVLACLLCGLSYGVRLAQVWAWAGDLLVRVRGDAGIPEVRRLQERHNGEG